MIKRDRGFILADTPCTFLLSSGDEWCSFVQSVKINKPDFRMIKPKSIEISYGKKADDKMVISDFNQKNPLKITPDSSGEIVISFKLDKKYTVTSFDHLSSANGNDFKIEVLKNGKWNEVGWGTLNEKYQQIMPASGKLFKITIKATQPLEITTFRLHRKK